MSCYGNDKLAVAAARQVPKITEVDIDQFSCVNHHTLARLKWLLPI